MSPTYKIAFHVFDLVGPQNACIGLAQTLQQRGHRIYFLINQQFANRFTKFGFTEVLLKEAVTPSKGTGTVDPITQICNDIMEIGLFQKQSTLEKLRKLGKMDLFEEMYQKSAAFEPQIKAFLEAERPDLLVIDADIAAPCLINSQLPWVYLFCSNPLGFFNNPDLPPFCSGYPIDSDRDLWSEFRAVQNEVHFAQILHYQRKLCTQFGYPINPKQTFIPQSPYLNIYQFPAELDYDDTVKLPENFLRVDAFIREEPEPFVLPAAFRDKMKPGDKLIYLSMGSMGSFDVSLMKRLVSVLGKTPHFYIVSKGLLAEQYALPENMWGAAHLPQTAILPLVDLAILHGGNNSLLEAIVNGKPVILFPLFYDQPDNGQRIREKGYGITFEPYDFTDEALVEAVDSLLADKEMGEKYRRMAKRIKESNSKLTAALRMEELVKEKAIFV